jgi:hypothetical protein
VPRRGRRRKWKGRREDGRELTSVNGDSSEASLDADEDGGARARWLTDRLPRRACRWLCAHLGALEPGHACTHCQVPWHARSCPRRGRGQRRGWGRHAHACAAALVRQEAAPLPSRWGRGRHAAPKRAQGPRPCHQCLGPRPLGRRSQGCRGCARWAAVLACPLRRGCWRPPGGCWGTPWWETVAGEMAAQAAGRAR